MHDYNSIYASSNDDGDKKKNNNINIQCQTTKHRYNGYYNTIII